MLPGLTPDRMDDAADPEPLGGLATRAQCKAMSKRSGKRCGRAPVPGLEVCHLHGAGTRAARAKSDRIVAARKATGIAHRLGVPVVVDPHEALLGALYSAWGDVVFWRHVVSELELKGGDSAGIIGVNHLGDQALHVAVGALSGAQERTAKFAKACLDAGFTERQVRVAEGQADVMERVLVSVLLRKGLDAADVRQLLAEELRQLGQGTIDVESEER